MKFTRLSSLLFVSAFLLFAAQLSASTLAFVTDPNTLFSIVYFTGPNDPASDQQTGQATGDIVGNAQNPAFLTGFDGTDLYFRVRLGALDTHGFSGLLWVGLDVTNDGKLDLFLGVNNQGSTSTIQFVQPGNGLNNSPSTTTIGNVQTGYSITETASNFNYQVVSSNLQPGITNTDLNTDGNTDAFLTFKVPFAGASGSATVQGALAGLAGIQITAGSPFSYVIGTSTQKNSLNQDIGGVNNKTGNLTLTYIQLGAISPQLNLDGSPYNPTEVPEPSTLLMAIGGFCIIASRVLRKHLFRN